MAGSDYETGYEEGERSAKFDMEFALSEYGDYSHYRAAIEALAKEAEAIEAEWDDAEESFTDPRRNDRLDAVQASGLYFHTSDDYYSMPIGKQVAAWLRSHIKDAD